MKVTFDIFEAKGFVDIVLDIDIVEPEPHASQQRAFPSLVTADDPIVDLLDLFRGESSVDGFDDI